VATLTRGRSRACAAALAAWLVFPAAPLRAEQRTATAEDDIKAAFLFNFTKFIEWPAGDRSQPFRICTVAEPAFSTAVDRTIAGETAGGGRPIERVSPATPDAARACHILFIGRLETERMDRWMTAVRGAPALVVGESRAAWDRGAQINFVVDGNRVKFDVNLDAANRAGLTVSSKLLRVARTVASSRRSVS
jgi:hypothetical protein